MFKDIIAKLQKDIDDRKWAIAQHYKYKTNVLFIKGQQEEIEELTNKIMFFERLG